MRINVGLLEVVSTRSSSFGNFEKDQGVNKVKAAKSFLLIDVHVISMYRGERHWQNNIAM